MIREYFVLLGGFAAFALFGYYMIAKLERFLDQVRRENEDSEETTCFNIATSCVNTIPAVSSTLKLYPPIPMQKAKDRCSGTILL